MKTRKLGKTGVVLTELGFGGAEIGNLYRATSNIEAFSAISSAWESEVRYFDTAPSYGYGLSERRIGDSLRAHPRNTYLISTKVGRLLRADATPKHQHDTYPGALPFRIEYDYSYDGIMRSFEDSLQRLGMDCIDILLVHDIGQYTHGDAHKTHLKTFLDNGYRALVELRSQKVIRAIGLGVNECEVCVEVIPNTDLDCIMLAGRYTLLEQGATTKFFPLCKERNVSVIIASPFNSGILAYGKNYNYETANSKIIAQVNKLKRICDEYQIDLPHAAIQFPLLHPQVVSVVAGLRTQEQASVAAEYLKTPIPLGFWEELKTKHLLTEDAQC